MGKKLEGKMAVVTGGSSGIGLATAKRFVEEGAYVFITGRREKELNAAVESIGENVTGVQSDVSNLADLDRLYDRVREEKGRVDVLFANAGGGAFVPLGEITEEHFDRVFDGNVKGLVFTVQKALPLMPDGGSIILNASIAASTGPENFSVYAASKAAVRSFARSWTTDLRARRIRVNALSPGYVPTPAYDYLGIETKALEASVVPTIPLGRVGTPDEIAKVAVFLASDDSSYVTGIDLIADGGVTQV